MAIKIGKHLKMYNPLGGQTESKSAPTLFSLSGELENQQRLTGSPTLVKAVAVAAQTMHHFRESKKYSRPVNTHSVH